jgi:hypothetical protein
MAPARLMSKPSTCFWAISAALPTVHLLIYSLPSKPELLMTCSCSETSYGSRYHQDPDPGSCPGPSVPRCCS